MRLLNLTVTKKWFDMTASGVKKQEYREIKPYWAKRFLGHKNLLNPYSHVLIRHGYASDAPVVLLECQGITIGPAKPEWSDNWQGDVFVIQHGNIIPVDSVMFFNIMHLLSI